MSTLVLKINHNEDSQYFGVQCYTSTLHDLEAIWRKMSEKPLILQHGFQDKCVWSSHSSECIMSLSKVRQYHARSSNHA